jgi:hypothetical protein
MSATHHIIRNYSKTSQRQCFELPEKEICQELRFLGIKTAERNRNLSEKMKLILI